MQPIKYFTFKGRLNFKSYVNYKKNSLNLKMFLQKFICVLTDSLYKRNPLINIHSLENIL